MPFRYVEGKRVGVNCGVHLEPLGLEPSCRGQPDYRAQVYCAIDIGTWIDPNHALRALRRWADEVLSSMRREVDRAYAKVGRPSIIPEMLLRALLLQALFSIRSEPQLIEQIQMNLLYRWFINLSLDGKVWEATTFTKNRERCEKHGVLGTFFDFDRVVSERAHAEEWASSENFTVDRILIESYALMKSLRPVDTSATRVSNGSDDGDQGNPAVNFRRENRSNRTHRSLTDPEARLARKSHDVGSKLCHAAHLLMENRSGLVVDVSVSQANGFAEREEAMRLVRRTKKRHRVDLTTLATDKGYGAGTFLHELETGEGVVPLVPLPTKKFCGDGPEARARRKARRWPSTKRYTIAQRIRRRVEETFGWTKEIGGFRPSRHVGRWMIHQQALVVNAAYNLLRMARLEVWEQAA